MRGESQKRKLFAAGFHSTKIGGRKVFYRAVHTHTIMEIIAGPCIVRSKTRFYVGPPAYLKDGETMLTPSPFELMAGPFKTWAAAVACYNVTAGVEQ